MLRFALKRMWYNESYSVPCALDDIVGRVLSVLQERERVVDEPLHRKGCYVYVCVTKESGATGVCVCVSLWYGKGCVPLWKGVLQGRLD